MNKKRGKGFPGSQVCFEKKQQGEQKKLHEQLVIWMICDKNVIYPLALSHSKEHQGGGSKCWCQFFFFAPIAITAVAVIIAYLSVSGVVEQRHGPYSWQRPFMREFLGGDGDGRVHLKLHNHSLNFWRLMPQNRTSCYIRPSRASSYWCCISCDLLSVSIAVLQNMPFSNRPKIPPHGRWTLI